MKKILFLILTCIIIGCQEDTPKSFNKVVVLKENIINFKIDTQTYLLTFGDFYIDMPQIEYNKIIDSKKKYIDNYLKKSNTEQSLLFLWGLKTQNNETLAFIPVTEVDSAKKLNSFTMMFSLTDNSTFLNTKNSTVKKLAELKSTLKDIVNANIKLEPIVYHNNYVWCLLGSYIKIEEGINEVSIHIVRDKKSEFSNLIKNETALLKTHYYLDSLAKKQREKQSN